ncbi:PAS domain-containing protein [Streptomyces sp. NPDC058287]|uniref:PAS domain-containing protein n=1 Tax=Streptomyces sp. NPDC058287 TaxID=3346423 RepID=UPI0036E7CCF5
MSAAQDSAGHLSGGLGDAVLRALFTKSPVGLFVFDTGLRIVHMNVAARNVRAFPVEEFLGFTLAEALQGISRGRAEAVEALAREVLESGTPRRDVQVTARSRHAPYREFVLSTSWLQLSNERGQVLGVAASITDVTERHKAQARLVLLEGASARIGTTLDVFRTAQDLAPLCQPWVRHPVLPG